MQIFQRQFLQNFILCREIPGRSKINFWRDYKQILKKNKKIFHKIIREIWNNSTKIMGEFWVNFPREWVRNSEAPGHITPLWSNNSASSSEATLTYPHFDLVLHECTLLQLSHTPSTYGSNFATKDKNSVYSLEGMSKINNIPYRLFQWAYRL